MDDLTTLRNIGPEIARKLRAVGIATPAELAASGSKDAFRKMRQMFPNVCLVHLYCLQGALDDREMNELPEQTKDDLKRFSDRLRLAPTD